MGGSTGLIGRSLVQSLRTRGDQVIELARRGDAGIRWDGRSVPAGALEGADAVVNLAGANVAARRWSPEFKEELRQSRILSTRALVEAIRGTQRKPRVLVNASAVGFYGPRGDEAVDETAAAGTDFLAQLCKDWEAEARRADVRSVQLRTGIVLDENDGALAKMLPPFKAFVGGPIGSGKQWMPWIHQQDEVAAVVFCIDRELSGPVNLVSPGAVTMQDFAREIGRALHRPAWAPVPAAALKVLIGEFAEALLGGQRAVPSKLLAAGFQFRFPALPEALRDLLERR